MKQLFLFIFLCIFLAGCKTTANHVKPDPYINLNVDYVVKNCKPEESYSFPVFGLLTMPARFKSCADIDQMFVVAWPGENSEIEQTTAKLLTLLWVRSWNDEKDPDYKASFIKHDSRNKGAQNQLNMSFYELTEVVIEVPKIKTTEE